MREGEDEPNPSLLILPSLRRLQNLYVKRLAMLWRGLARRHFAIKTFTEEILYSVFESRMARACVHGSYVHSLCSNFSTLDTNSRNSSCNVCFTQRTASLGDDLIMRHSISGFTRQGGQNWGAMRRSCCRGKLVRAVSATGDRVEDSLPTQEEIIAAAKEKGLLLAIKVTAGLLFVVTAIDVETGENLGTADGFIKPWIDGNILHLDSIRLTKASATRSGRTIFGAAVYMGALMVRFGIDSACDKGELLAINDSDEYHRKLVRYYSRLGWKPVHEVTGDSVRDFAHMLVWGGVGTRMDADLRELLGKWAKTLLPTSASKAKAMVET